MSQYTHRLNLAANVGLDRRDCRICKTETLHRHYECIHCGAICTPPTSSEDTISMREAMGREEQMHRARVNGAKNSKRS